MIHLVTFYVFIFVKLYSLKFYVANVLEVDVVNPETHGLANKRYTDYEVRLRVINLDSNLIQINIIYNKILFLKTNLPVFKIKESSVRRRFSDFEWLRNELERGSKVY